MSPPTQKRNAEWLNREKLTRPALSQFLLKILAEQKFSNAPNTYCETKHFNTQEPWNPPIEAFELQKIINRRILNLWNWEMSGRESVHIQDARNGMEGTGKGEGERI